MEISPEYSIDVSKEKSTVCVLKPYGEIVMKPKDVQHIQRCYI